MRKSENLDAKVNSMIIMGIVVYYRFNIFNHATERIKLETFVNLMKICSLDIRKLSRLATVIPRLFKLHAFLSILMTLSKEAMVVTTWSLVEDDKSDAIIDDY